MWRVTEWSFAASHGMPIDIFKHPSTISMTGFHGLLSSVKQSIGLRKQIGITAPHDQSLLHSPGFELFKLMFFNAEIQHIPQ
jgi:hypothetical protein